MHTNVFYAILDVVERGVRLSHERHSKCGWIQGTQVTNLVFFVVDDESAGWWYNDVL